MNHRTGISVLAVVAALAATASETRGQFTSLQQTLFRDFFFIGDQTFSQFPDGGPLFENNIFDQAIRYNRLGDGWTYEEFRFFGTDTFNDPSQVDLGFFQVRLGPDANINQNVQPVGIHNSFGYTTRFIPQFTFLSQTGQRAFNQFSGQTSFSPTPVRYDVIFNTGVQDVEWSGNILLDTQGNVNAMGFYDFQLRVMNQGNFEADGLAYHDEQVTDFDTGQVDVSGNLLFDGLASLAQTLGFTSDAATPRIVSSASGDLGKEQRVDDLLARLESGEALNDEDMEFLVSEMVMTAFLNDPLGFLQNGLPEQVEGFEALSLELSDEPVDTAVPAAVPEPGTILLVAIGALGYHALRPLRRNRRAAGKNRF